MIRAVVFDMDGVLIDTEPIWRAVEIDVYRHLGLELTEERLLETMGVRLAEAVAMWHNRYPWSGPSPLEVASIIEERVIEEVLARGAPRPGACETLSIIHQSGLPIGIASSSSERMIKAVVDRLQIGNYIDVICTADHEVEGKPHPAVYLTTARLLGVAPEECLAFEDSPNGVLSARAAGMYCVAIPDAVMENDPRINASNLRLNSLEEFTPRLFSELRGIPERDRSHPA